MAPSGALLMLAPPRHLPRTPHAAENLLLFLLAVHHIALVPLLPPAGGDAQEISVYTAGGEAGSASARVHTHVHACCTSVFGRTSAGTTQLLEPPTSTQMLLLLLKHDKVLQKVVLCLK